MKLKQWLKNAREEAHLEQKPLAEKSGVSHETIGKIERGINKNPTILNLLALIDALTHNRERALRRIGILPEIPEGNDLTFLECLNDDPVLDAKTKEFIAYLYEKETVLIRNEDDIRKKAASAGAEDARRIKEWNKQKKTQNE